MCICIRFLFFLFVHSPRILRMWIGAQFVADFNLNYVCFFFLVFSSSFLSMCTRSLKIDMVCYEEGSAQCVVHNTMPGATTKRIILMVRPSYKVSQLFHDIRNQMQVENFDVSLQTQKEEEEVSDVMYFYYLLLYYYNCRCCIFIVI